MLLLHRRPKEENQAIGCARHAVISSSLEGPSAGSATLPVQLRRMVEMGLGVGGGRTRVGRLQPSAGGHQQGVTDPRGPRPVRMADSGRRSVCQHRQAEWEWEERWLGRQWEDALGIGLVRSVLTFSSPAIRSAASATLIGLQVEASSHLALPRRHIRGQGTGCAHNVGTCNSHATATAASATPKNLQG